MKIPCSVIRDLLPLVAEKLVEPDTDTLVEEHLSECADCRQRLSELHAAPVRPVDTADELRNLKKQIRKRRLCAALIAALCVFIAVFVFFFRTENGYQVILWREDLFEVKGVQTVTPEDRAGRSYLMPDDREDLPRPDEYAGEALVLVMNNLCNGFDMMTADGEDGSQSVVLRAFGPNRKLMNSAGDSSEEIVLYPVPERLYYDDGELQHLLWGETQNGGGVILPRLTLVYYLLIAAAAALVLGFLWFGFRNRRSGNVLRQLFFAPLSYILSHLLLKGFVTHSFSLFRELICLLLIAAALYFLMTLLWGAWVRHRRDTRLE